MKRAALLTDFFALLVLAWMGIAALPLSSFWFKPELVVVQDAPVKTSPKMGFTREIKRPVLMRYSVIVRDVHLAVVCESPSPLIEYKPDATLPEDLDLDWWTDGDCPTLPTGTYIVETCWTATERFWGLLPDRSACVASNTFRVW